MLLDYISRTKQLNTINTSFCEKTIEISQVWKKKVGTKTHIFLRMWARNKKNTGKAGHARFFWSQSCYFCPIPRYSDFFHDAFGGLGIFVPIPGSPHKALGSVALRPSPRPVHCGRLAVDLSCGLSGSAFRSF